MSCTSSITVRTSHESSFSRRHFNWIISRVEGIAGANRSAEDEEVLAPSTATSDSEPLPSRPPRGVLFRIWSVLRAALSGRVARPPYLGSRVIGTLFGPRRGHVRFAIQVDPRASPALLVELAMPTASLIKEMASGLVRVALECERKSSDFGSSGGKVTRLVEERLWRAYCNGRKCGYALRRDCSPGDSRLLHAVEPVTMGAGILPPDEAEEGRTGEGEMMYMRARFERVVGSKDSEALYMMNPDGKSGVPELSIYLLRV